MIQIKTCPKCGFFVGWDKVEGKPDHVESAEILCYECLVGDRHKGYQRFDGAFLDRAHGRGAVIREH